jgi:hypothetical protein
MRNPALLSVILFVGMKHVADSCPLLPAAVSSIFFKGLVSGKVDEPLDGNWNPSINNFTL